MSVFLAQQMRQYSLLFRIFTDFTLSTQKTEKSTVHFHTEFQVYKDALPKLEIMIYSALIPVPMAEAPRPAAMKSKLWNHSFLIHAHMKNNNYPRTTSSVIIIENPTANAIVPMFECLPSDISGISSSITTYIIAPAAKLKRYGIAGTMNFDKSMVKAAATGSTAPESIPYQHAFPFFSPCA